MSIKEGRELRDQALEQFEDHRPNYLAEARHAAKNIYLMTLLPVTVNDVRKVCPPPDDVDPRIMGSIFNRKDWCKVGTTPSDRKICHGRYVATFIPNNTMGGSCDN